MAWACDGFFLNYELVLAMPTPHECELLGRQSRRGSSRCRISFSGFLGDHGATILNARGELALDAAIESDTRPLHGLVQAMLAACPDIHCMRDATRGGLATVVNEFAQASGVGIVLNEEGLPLREAVRGVCAILGLDPLYFANEGKLVAVVPGESAEQVLSTMRLHPAGIDAAIIGSISAGPPGLVTLRTRFGGERVLDTLIGEQLPRIC